MICHIASGCREKPVSANSGCKQAFGKSANHTFSGGLSPQVRSLTLEWPSQFNNNLLHECMLQLNIFILTRQTLKPSYKAWPMHDTIIAKIK